MHATADIFQKIRTHEGHNLDQLSQQQELMIVFLRHFGCPWCRKVLHELSQSQDQIKSYGTRLVLVHMCPPHLGKEQIDKYGFNQLDLVSDPRKKLYRHFGLRSAKRKEIYGWNVLKLTMRTGTLFRHGIGLPLGGDIKQLPGVFVFFKSDILYSHLSSDITDNPEDFVDFAACGC